MILLHFEDFTEFLSKNEYNKSTIQSYSYSLLNFVDFLNKNKISFNKIDSTTINNYINFSLENNKAKSTININISCLKKYFEYLFKYKNFSFNFNINEIKQIKYKRLDKTEVIFKDIEKVLENLKRCEGLSDKRDYIILQLIIKTGLRISNLVKIKRDDILNNKIVVGQNIYYIEKTLLKEINCFVKNIKSEYIFNPYRARKNSKNNALTTRSTERIIKKYFPNNNYNDLKLVYYRLMCEKIFDIKEIKKHSFVGKIEIKNINTIL